MNEALGQAIQLLLQGMAGIFVVLGVIALSVIIVQKIEAMGSKK